MLIPSVTPLMNSAASETQKIVDSPNTIMLTPKPGDADRAGSRRRGDSAAGGSR